MIVPHDQVEALRARSSSQSSLTPKRHCKVYPLLHAAMVPKEDEVMVCALILEDAKDVTLVREAAAYLEEVEAHIGGSF